MAEYGFIIDLEKCVGCHGCSMACKQANGTPPKVTRSHVVRAYEGTYPDTVRIIRPMLCMMCAKPTCVAACSTGASYIDENGIVLIDKEKCDGCGACIEACPYDARYMIEEGTYYSEPTEYESVIYSQKGMVAGTVDKCDFCIGHNGDGTPNPVCVQACMTEARIFGPLEDIKKMVADRGGDVYMPETGNEPRVYYLPVMKN